MPIVAYEDELSKINYRTTALAIGIEIDGADWMELSSEELKVLSLVLTKPVLGDASAASEYPMLRMLAAWATAAARAAAEVEREDEAAPAGTKQK